MGCHSKNHHHNHHHCELKKSCHKSYLFGQCDLPLVIRKSGTYSLKEDVVFKTCKGRWAIDVQVDNVCIDLCCHEIVLDYCYDGEATYVPEHAGFNVYRAAVHIKDHSNVSITNGSIRGIDVPDLTTKTDWYAVVGDGNPVRNVSCDKVSVKNLRGNLIGRPTAIGESTAKMYENWSLRNGTVVDTFFRAAPNGLSGNDAIVSSSVGTFLSVHIANNTPRWGTGITGTLLAANPLNASTPLINAAQMAGKIALVERGAVTFTQKALNCQNAGAIGIIIYNNVALQQPAVTIDETLINIPVAYITMADGAILFSNQPITVNVFGWDWYESSVDPLGLAGGNAEFWQLNGFIMENMQLISSTRDYALLPYAANTTQISGYVLEGHPELSSQGIYSDLMFRNNRWVRCRYPLILVPAGDLHGDLIVEDNTFLLSTGDPDLVPYIWTCCASDECVCRSQLIRNNTIKFEDNDGEDMPDISVIFAPSGHSIIIEGNAISAPNSVLGASVQTGLVSDIGNIGNTVVIRNNTLQGNGNVLTHVICTDGAGYTIDNNDITGAAIGVQLTPFGSGPVGPSFVQNNRISSCEIGINLDNGAVDTLIDENKLTNCSNTAIIVDTGVTDTIITRNIFGNTNGTNLTDNGTGTVVPLAGTGININGP